MTDVTARSGDVFDRLLEAMPRIAEAVNAFASEENQRAALDALVQALGVAPETPTIPSLRTALLERNNGDEEVTQLAGSDSDGEEIQTSTSSGRVRPGNRRRRSTKKPETIRDLDFRPEGKQAFKDLVEEKKPRTIDEKNVMAVFWLEQIAGIQNIGAGHVMAAYKDRDWREPADPVNALQATASREHWIDTKNMSAIATTPSGRNHVNFEMPSKANR